MRRYYTKESLYKEIDSLRSYIGITPESYPIDTVSLCCARDDFEIGEWSFKTKGLKGILLTCDGLNAIMLDANQSTEEKNFFCTHELIHSALHRDLGIKAFNCFERTLPQQDSAIEWQANEGAAELLVPYSDFIPSFVQLLHEQKSCGDSYLCIRSLLAEKYHVSYQVIYNRIENLRYEIDQYIQGVDINQIMLLSKRKQTNLGIITTNYNAMCDFEISFA